METQPLPTDITYRTYIEREFKARCRRNPSYSLRAYARDLQVPPSKLSEVLRHTCGLSAQSATALAPRLRLTEKEAEHFVTLVESEHSRSSTRKEQAKKLLEQFQLVNGVTELDLEKYKVISDWYHYAILELMTLDHFVSSNEWMAEQLGLDVATVIEALNRLVRVQLIENIDGAWKTCEQNTSSPSHIPSREIREHHFQILQKATASIEDQPMDERDLATMTLAIDEKDFPVVKQRLKEFRRSLASDLQKSVNRDRVFCLSTQFFPLSKKKDQL